MDCPRGLRERRRLPIASKSGLHIGHVTHRGVVRELNEDSYLALTGPAISPEVTALLAVADGMGGHQAGDVASNEVIRALYELFSSSLYQDKVGYNTQREDYYVLVLKEVLELINDRVYRLACSRSDLAGMGSTGSVVLLANRRLYVGHVGDSRIYRLRASELQRLTLDHTWVAEQVTAGLMTPEQAANDPRRSRLTRSLGIGSVLRVDRSAHDLQAGDVLLLCTDGLTGVVGDGEFVQILATLPPQLACDRLVEMALQRGGPDNITVIVAQIGDGEGSDLAGGMAYGPYAQEVLTAQQDTVKILRPKPPKRSKAARRAGGRKAGERSGSLRRFLGVVSVSGAALVCALVGWFVLGGDWAGQPAGTGTGQVAQLAVPLVSALVGAAAGYVAARLSSHSGRKKGPPGSPHK